ncbi:MAG: hypothetical protein JSR73_19070 [Proteobacteria bacterium]|nr:hypothetical protein [Pseudomonadota bacterium]
MLTTKFRHWAVAMSLVAAVGVTGASAAVSAHRAAPATRVDTLPVPSGDLGEVVVYAPHDLPEVVVHAPRDLGEVLVTVHPTPPAGTYLAHVVVTAPRVDADVYRETTEAAATLASAQ